MNDAAPGRPFDAGSDLDRALVAKPRPMIAIFADDTLALPIAVSALLAGRGAGKKLVARDFLAGRAHPGIKPCLAVEWNRRALVLYDASKHWAYNWEFPVGCVWRAMERASGLLIVRRDDRLEALARFAGISLEWRADNVRALRVCGCAKAACAKCGWLVMLLDRIAAEAPPRTIANGPLLWSCTKAFGFGARGTLVRITGALVRGNMAVRQRVEVLRLQGCVSAEIAEIENGAPVLDLPGVAPDTILGLAAPGTVRVVAEAVVEGDAPRSIARARTHLWAFGGEVASDVELAAERNGIRVTSRRGFVVEPGARVVVEIRPDSMKPPDLVFGRIGGDAR